MLISRVVIIVRNPNEWLDIQSVIHLKMLF